MSHRVALITDSTVALPQALLERYQIRVVPLYIQWGGKTLRDGVDLTPQDLYRQLRNSKETPTTSQPSQGDFLRVYREAVEEGAEVLLVFLLSSRLSATYSTGVAAREVFLDELRAQGRPLPRIEVVDTRTIATAMGFILLEAARALEAGASVEEALEAARRVQERVRFLFTVETLEYLRRGGRIGGAAALLGSALRLRPILHLVDGAVEPLERVRTTRTARRRLAELVVQEMAGKGKVNAAVLHADDPEGARVVRETLERELDLAELIEEEIPAVVGVHIGPGGVGVCFYGEEG